MIIDFLKNANIYSQMNERIALAFNYISKTDFSNIKPGKYPIDGDIVYAAVSEYHTKSITECKIEAHKKYIDLQYIISGKEAMGVTNLNNQQPTVPYDDKNDCVFYDCPTSLINFEAGMFAIYFSQDLHQPCISIGDGCMVKKVVVKIRFD